VLLHAPLVPPVFPVAQPPLADSQAAPPAVDSLVVLLLHSPLVPLVPLVLLHAQLVLLVFLQSPLVLLVFLQSLLVLLVFLHAPLVPPVFLHAQLVPPVLLQSPLALLVSLVLQLPPAVFPPSPPSPLLPLSPSLHLKRQNLISRELDRLAIGELTPPVPFTV